MGRRNGTLAAHPVIEVMMETVLAERAKKPGKLRLAAGIALGVWAALVLIYFPYATDAQPSPAEVAKTIAYYGQAYAAPPAAVDSTRDPNEDVYVKVAQEAAAAFHVKENLEGFLDQYKLHGKKVLDVGAGQGYLQDVAEDYTGLDISPTARRFFHKPFVLGSATAMPFADNQFDVVWSIWVLEHIPTPEQALREMRRVTKDGGYLYLYPAWACSSWLADGYEVRPYADFGLTGKLIKASVPIRSSAQYRAIYTAPIRALRFAAYRASGSPTRFHYSRLTPNYQKYWQSDGDAVNTLDRYEALLWFASRGDECVNCDRSVLGTMWERAPDYRLIIRVHKQ
jgi:SAM-dependent methyltransferase